MKFYIYSFISVLLLSFVSCARIGSPSGGPKDETAPFALYAKPENKQLNFNQNEIKIFFNELITLDKPTQEIIFSPPLKNNVVIKPQGTPKNYIQLKLNDTLQKETTYIINFGKSIKDNTEGNLLPNFKYVFSTGNSIDSLELKGTILDAKLGKLEDKMIVALYKKTTDFNDSVLLKEKPFYISLTDSAGRFEFNHLKKGNYKIAAFSNSNGRYVTDLRNDKIAFQEKVIQIPTTQKTTLSVFQNKKEFNHLKPKYIKPGLIQFYFEGNNINPKATIQYKTGFQQWSKNKDTLKFYYKPNFENKRDSLISIISNKNKIIDTLKFKFKENAKELDPFELERNNKKYKPFKTINLSFNYPIKKINNKLINVITKDSTKIPFKVFINQKNNTKLTLNFNGELNRSYIIQLDSLAITSMHKQNNSPISKSINMLHEDNLGELIVQIKNGKKRNLIVQLLDDDKESIIDEVITTKSIVKFNYLKKGIYVLRVIIDQNKNNKWDTGDYFKHQQPEKIIYHENTLEIRPLWEVNEIITL